MLGSATSLHGDSDSGTHCSPCCCGVCSQPRHSDGVGWWLPPMLGDRAAE